MRGMVTDMPRFDLRPSKPHALFVAFGALAILVFGLVQMIRDGGFDWFYVIWVLVGLFVIGGALAQGFSRRRGTQMATVEAEDERDAVPIPMRMAHNKPFAVIGSIVGLGIIGFATVRMASGGQGLSSALFFGLFGLAIIGFNLWSAFGRKGAAYTVTRRD
jgi:hypothetical protein